MIYALNTRKRKDEARYAFLRAADRLTVFFSAVWIAGVCIWGNVTAAADSVTWTPVVNLTADYEHQVGDLVSFEASVGVRDAGTWGEEVVFSQKEIPDGLVLQEDSVVISGAQGSVEVGEKGWRILCDRLNYGEELTVSYDMLVTEEANGQELFSEVGVYAQNLSSAPQEGTPYIDEWNNTADLSIDMVTDPVDQEAGDPVHCMICLTNVNDQTVAENVILTIEDLENVLTLTEDVQYSGVPKVVSVPIRDYLAVRDTAERENACDVIVRDGTLAFQIDYLPANMPVVLLLSGTATQQAAEGVPGEVAASADNAALSQSELTFVSRQMTQEVPSSDETGNDARVDDSGEEETPLPAPVAEGETDAEEEKEPEDRKEKEPEDRKEKVSEDRKEKAPDEKKETTSDTGGETASNAGEETASDAEEEAATQERAAASEAPVDAVAILLLLALLVTTICIIWKNAYSGRQKK